MRLGPSKTGLSPPPSNLFYCSFQGGASVVVLFVFVLGSNFLLFEPYVDLHIFI